MTRKKKKGRPNYLVAALLALGACNGSPEQRQSKLEAAVEIARDEIKAWEPFMGESERAYAKVAVDVLAGLNAGAPLDWKAAFDALNTAEPAVRAALEKRMTPEAAQQRISAFRLALRAVQLATL